MKCPHCGYDGVPAGAGFCPICGRAITATTQVGIHQQADENRGIMTGLQGNISGDVVDVDIQQVQIYVLSAAGREAGFGRFVKKDAAPYKFLASYTAQDQALFHGRDREIAEVRRRIKEQQMLVIYGQANVGKTSLLAAGVIPELIAKDGVLVISVPDYDQPIKSIYEALARTAQQVPIPLPEKVELPAIVRAATEATKGSLVLVFDHLERLFDPVINDTQRDGLVESLAQARQAVAPELLRLVFVVREEALGQVWRLQESLPDLLLSPFPLLPLSREQAADAILKPLKVLDNPITIEDSLLSERLIPDLNDLTPDTPGIQPAQLQIVCHQLYQMTRGRGLRYVDATQYDSVKGARGIMEAHVLETLRTQLAGEQAQAEQILLALASPGMGRWVSPEKLPPSGAGAKQAYDVLERLVKSELLLPRSIEGTRMYAFASEGVKENVRKLAAPEVQRCYRAADELERIWSAWLAHETETLATPAQVRYLARYGADLKPQPAKALLLLRSAVAGNEPAGPTLDWLRTLQSCGLIERLEDPAALRVKTSGSDTEAKARQLLCLDDPALPQPPDGAQGFGAVAWAAARHAQPVAWQVAALALTAPDPALALEHHLNRALYAGLRGWPRLKRASQLQGALADADPQRAQSSPPLTGSNPLLVWGWRVGRRIARDWQRIAGWVLGGGIGAGLALGLLRALLGIPARQLLGVQFAIYFYWAAILGAAMGGGMALAESLLLSDEASSWASKRALLAAGVGTIAFGLAHLLVAWLNGLSLSKAPLVAPLGFAAALGLALALYNQPRAGWRLGIIGWAGRLGIAALSFALIQWFFVAAKKQGPGIAIAWGGSFYRANWSWIGLAAWQRLIQNTPRWYDYMALADAALVGIALTLGVTAGVVVASRQLARWRDLAERAGD